MSWNRRGEKLGDRGARTRLIFAVWIAFVWLTPHVASAQAGPFSAKTAKYVFLFIGDGMGLPQRTAAEVFLNTDPYGNPRDEYTRLEMNRFPAQGLSTTFAADSFVTDSAAAVTALVCGSKTNSGVLGMDEGKTKRLPTVAELVKAKAKEFKIGIVTSVSLNHATPAGLYSHRPSRKQYYEIGTDLVESSVDYIAGGGLKDRFGKEKDKPDLIELARGAGWVVTTDQTEFYRLRPGAPRTIAINPVLDDEQAMPYAIDHHPESISLAEFTGKGIELLENPIGFFMMVEGGKIDWALHANDAATAIHDIIAFNEAIEEALRFYRSHPDDTLIIVTGDHETGGVTLGCSQTGHCTFVQNLGRQRLSFVEFNRMVDQYTKSRSAESVRVEDLMPLIQDRFGLIMLSAEERQELERKGGTVARRAEGRNGKPYDPDARQALSMTLTDIEIQRLREALLTSGLLRKKELRKEELQKDERYQLKYGANEPFTVTLTQILGNKAGIGWTSFYHTGCPVPVSAIGTGSELFHGYYDNTDVAKKIMAVIGIESAAVKAAQEDAVPARVPYGLAF